METLKKIVTNQYFPAGAVLAAVILFWLVGLLGGLSLLHNNQPPLTTLTWMLFVYTAAVLTPLAGLLAAVDLVRRWRRNRAAASTPAPGSDAPDVEPNAFEATVPADAPYDQARQQGQPEGDRPQAPTPPRPPAKPAGTKKNPKQPGNKAA